METVGIRVRALRKWKRLTQEELGAELGVSTVTISGLENGDSISSELAAKAVKYFKVDAEWLVNGIGDKPTGVIIPLQKNVEENPYKDALVKELKEQVAFYQELLRNLTTGGGVAMKQGFLKALNVAGAKKAPLRAQAA